jgi:hypothetical protein
MLRLNPLSLLLLELLLPPSLGAVVAAPFKWPRKKSRARGGKRSVTKWWSAMFRAYRSKLE